MKFFTESASLVSKLLCLSVCVSVCAALLFAFLKNILLLPFKKVKSPVYQLQKRFLREKLRKDIGLRFSNFCSEMVKNCHAPKEFFLDLGHSLLMDQDKQQHPIVDNGGGSVAVAVGVSDMCQVIGTPDT